jgi:hypothetical protein
MAVWYGGDGGGRQQAAASNDCWLRDVSRKKRRGKIKREVDRLGQKWATRGTGLGHIEEMGYII